MSWNDIFICPHTVLPLTSFLCSALIPSVARCPENMMLPPLCFTAGMVFSVLQVSPSSRPQTRRLQESRPISPCPFAISKIFFPCFCWSSSSLLGGLWTQDNRELVSLQIMTLLLYKKCTVKVHLHKVFYLSSGVEHSSCWYVHIPEDYCERLVGQNQNCLTQVTKCWSHCNQLKT